MENKLSAKLIIKTVPISLLFCGLMVSNTIAAVTSNFNETSASATSSANQLTETKENSIEGMILGKSTKAKVITVILNNKVEFLEFNDQTKGIENATKSSNVIIKYITVGPIKKAISVTSKLAALPDGVEEIDLDDLAELINGLDHSKYLLIDARPNSKYASGHIPTALSLPLIELQTNETALDKIGAKGKKLIFYSDGTTCSLCTKSAQLAAKRGFTDINVLLPGIQGWENEDEILTVSDNLVTEGNLVLIDIRTKNEVNNGHITDAVNISLEDLTDDEIEYEFPADRSAPVVLYGGMDDVTKAAEIIAGWGYKSIRQVEGGFSGWLDRDQKMSSGPLPGPEGISWTKRIGKNQVSKATFKKLISAQTKEALILDVRTVKETKRGKIKNSLNIPLEELAARRLEIPTDKEIFTHCATGSRAEMATFFLSQYRNDVHFLSAKVRCKGEKCRIK